MYLFVLCAGSDPAVTDKVIVLRLVSAEIDQGSACLVNLARQLDGMHVVRRDLYVVMPRQAEGYVDVQ